MDRTGRAVITAFALRMIAYKFWGKSASIIPRLRPHWDMPFMAFDRTSSKSITPDPNSFIAGDKSAWH